MRKEVIVCTCVVLLMVSVSGPATGKGKPGGGGAGTDLGIPAVGLGLPEGCSSAADVQANGLGDDGAAASTVSIAAWVQACQPTSPPQPYL
jgi:hypothetical protein